MDTADGALTQLRAWLAQRNLGDDERLPPERELCDILGVSRGELRKALAIMERDGELWRHVGKGTFLGPRPVEDISSVGAIAEKSNPLEVMQARLVIEPLLAREAAINATGAHLEEMRRCVELQRKAKSWRQYENADNRLHRLVAEAAGNTVMVSLFDQLNAIRRAVVWGRMRNETDLPPANHHSFNQHDELISAIAERDPDAAYAAMRDHLMTVRDKLLRTHAAA